MFSSKDTFGVKFSNFLKVSHERTLLESIFPEDTLHIEKTTLHLEIFLNQYYMKNFLFFYTKCLKSPTGSKHRIKQSPICSIKRLGF